MSIMLIRDTDRGGFEHRAVFQQRLIDLSRGDVLTTFDDEFLDAACDEQESVLVAVAEVPRAQPAVGGKRFGRLLGRLVIAFHHVRAAHHDFPRCPGRQQVAFGIHHLGLVAKSLPRAADLASTRMERIGETWGRRLGQSHGLDDADLELLFERAVLARRQRCRCRTTEAHTASIETLNERIGSIEQIRNDRGHHIEPSAAIPIDKVPKVGHAKTMGQD